jgi:hypothetical protein
MRKIALSLAAFAALLCLVSSAAHAQTRTWVSGVGDDLNPCSRTAPCKTFAGAISKTATGGEISVLDSGGFGTVTITKSISIVAEGAEGGILSAGTSGIIVNAGSSGVVNIRGLIIEGAGTGTFGIRFISGKALHVQDCLIRGVGSTALGNGLGILFAPNSASSQLEVQNTTIADNFTGGVLIQPVPGGSAKVVLDRVHLDNNGGFGYRADATSGAINSSLKETIATGNGGAGIDALAPGGSAAVVNLDQSNAVNNTTGILSEGSANAIVRIGSSTVTGNGTGLSATGGGTILSYKTNNLVGNAVEGAPTAFLIPN